MTKKPKGPSPIIFPKVTKNSMKSKRKARKGK
jgi:hypothetical protein